jgi:hypothetical protein
MPFTIPGQDVAGVPARQSPWYSTDIAILVAALAGTGVLTGCGVTAQGSPDMTLAVAAGSIQPAAGAASVAVTAGNVTITTADGTNPRIDLVSASATGTKTVTAGTAAASPKPPDLPSGHVALAMVDVPASDTAISSGQITDKRCTVFALPAARAPAVPVLVQMKGASAGAVTSITLDAAPANGHSIILVFDATTGQVSAVTSTNTTWTQILAFTSTAGSRYAIWVGSVAGGAGGATISWTLAGSNCSMIAMEITDTLTRTAGVTASGNNPGNNVTLDLAASTAGHIIVVGSGCDNTSSIYGSIWTSIPMVGPPHGGAPGSVIVGALLGYSQGYPVRARFELANAGAALMAEIS